MLFTVVIVTVLVLVGVHGQVTLVNHCLQLNHQHPMSPTSAEALHSLRTHFSALPQKLASCALSCSEHSDPRMSSLCHFMTVKWPGYPHAADSFKYDVSGELTECVNRQSYPSPLYNVVAACADQIYADEDALLTSLHQHFVKTKAPEAAVEFLDGVTGLLKDLRPMSGVARVLTAVCMLAAVGLIAFCIYRFLFGGDLLKSSDL